MPKPKEGLSFDPLPTNKEGLETLFALSVSHLSEIDQTSTPADPEQHAAQTFTFLMVELLEAFKKEGLWSEDNRMPFDFELSYKDQLKLSALLEILIQLRPVDHDPMDPMERIHLETLLFEEFIDIITVHDLSLGSTLAERQAIVSRNRRLKREAVSVTREYASDLLALFRAQREIEAIFDPLQRGNVETDEKN